ncbi:hypothetical protein BY996DRAFT_2070232 [Phakopsora pachyrhizi]|nr:hypothetical protein BY996DRAFT_2070232 [Phakopsora pachyrhizi]
MLLTKSIINKILKNQGLYIYIYIIIIKKTIWAFLFIAIGITFTIVFFIKKKMGRGWEGLGVLCKKFEIHENKFLFIYYSNE